jgi:hypothetical protein
LVRMRHQAGAPDPPSRGICSRRIKVKGHHLTLRGVVELHDAGLRYSAAEWSPATPEQRATGLYRGRT